MNIEFGFSGEGEEEPTLLKKWLYCRRVREDSLCLHVFYRDNHESTKNWQVKRELAVVYPRILLLVKINMMTIVKSHI